MSHIPSLIVHVLNSHSVSLTCHLGLTANIVEEAILDIATARQLNHCYHSDGSAR